MHSTRQQEIMVYKESYALAVRVRSVSSNLPSSFEVQTINGSHEPLKTARPLFTGQAKWHFNKEVNRISPSQRGK